MGQTPPLVVVIGVAGSGKTTIGRLLAARLGVAYAEADDFHPAANIAKMRAGRPLDDADRAPWLAAIADWLRGRAATGEGGVVSCSALKVAYRDVLRGSGAPVWFLHLHAGAEQITARVAGRSGHFMPASLVASQFAALQPLQPWEHGMVVDATAQPEEIVTAALGELVRPDRGGTSQ